MPVSSIRRPNSPQTRQVSLPQAAGAPAQRVRDTLESMTSSDTHPGSQLTFNLKKPSKTPRLLSYSMAAIGFALGYLAGALRKMDDVSKMALGFGGGITLYSISFLPKAFQGLKNSSERFWASLDVAHWSLSLIQKSLSLTAYIPKIALQATKVFWISTTSSILSFITFIISAVTSARALLAFRDIKQLHHLGAITAEKLKNFISTRAPLKWLLENHLGDKVDQLNNLIEQKPIQAANWIRRVAKGTLVFASLYTLSQMIAASAIIAGLCGAGMSGIPFFITSAILYGLTWITDSIAAKIWNYQLSKN